MTVPPSTGFLPTTVEPGASRHRWAVRWTLVVLLLLGSLLRFSGLGTRGLWGDELWTADACSEPTLGAMVDSFAQHHQLPISLSFFAARFSVALAQDSPSRDLWLRLPTALAGILGIVLIFALGRRLVGPNEALVAAFLLAVSPFHIRHSQIARYYGIYMALTTLALYLFWKARTTNRWPWWAGFALASIAGNYTHFFAAFVPLVCGLHAGTVSAFRLASAVRAGQAGPILRRELRSLIPVLVSCLVILAAWVPIVPMVARFWSSPLGAGAGERASIQLSPALFADLVSHFADEYWVGPATVLLLALLLVGLWSFARQRREVAWFALLLFLVPCLIVCGIQPRHIFGGKYVIFMLPVFLLVVAEGIARLHRITTHLAVLRPLRQTPVISGLLLAGVCLGSAFYLRNWYALDTEDWPGAAAYLQARVEPGDLVVCDGEWLGAGGDHARVKIGLGLYLDANALGVRLVREYQAVDAAAMAADGPQRVWAVVWHRQPLNQLATGSVVVQQFSQVTVLRTAARAPRAMQEELRAILVALLIMQPRADARADLLAALQELYACDPEQYVEDGVRTRPTAVNAALEACAWASRVRIQGTGSAQDHYDRGERLAQAGQWDAAWTELGQAVALAPQKGAYHQAYGWSLFRAGAPVELARTELRLAAEGMPDKPWPRFYLAEIALAEGEAAEALRLARQGIEVRPDLFSGWVLQGRAFRLLGRLQEAAASLQHAIELAPEKPAPYAALGRLLEEQDRLDEAAETYQRAVELAPDNVGHLLRLAGAYHAGGHLSEATAAYQRVLELSPGSPAAEKALQALGP